jgi:hypothetical protein
VNNNAIEEMNNGRYITAWDLCKDNDWEEEYFAKVAYGSVLWEAAVYKDSCDKVILSRVVESGGKSFLMGLGYKQSYVKPETPIILIPKKIIL